MSPPIYTPDGSEVSEIVLPDGSTASEVIGPNGNVVFEAGPDIPDSALAQYNAQKDSQATGGITTLPDQRGSLDLSGNTSLVSNGINANQSYQFNGSSDIVERDYAATFTQPFTIFIAVELLDDTRANTPFTGFSGRTEIYWNPNPNNWAMFAGNSVVEGGPADTTAVLTAAFDGANSFLRVNGTQVDSGDVGPNDPGGVILGYNRTLNGRYFDGYLGEVLLVDGVLDSQTIADQEDRIANAYNITIA